MEEVASRVDVLLLHSGQAGIYREIAPDMKVFQQRYSLKPVGNRVSYPFCRVAYADE